MILDWIFQSSGKRIFKKMLPVVDKINSLEPLISQLTREEMLAKMEQFKTEVHGGLTTLDNILPEVFAMIRESSKRTIGKRPFDVQMIGGCIIHQGMIAEMKTGEGKTLVATLPAILNAISGKTVFVVSVNDYLVKRDCELLRPIYEYLGITVDYVVPSCDTQVKLRKYNANIVYITNNEVCFDYLRDNMAKSMKEKLQKNHYFAIIDEVDNILIDEARTPLIISGPDNENSDLYAIINPVIYTLEDHDYEIEPKSKNVTLKNTGFDKIEAFLSNKNLIHNNLFSENVGIYHIVSNLLKAHKGMIRDKDYVVFKDEVIIVDEFTGRLAFGRKFSNGLHQALEAKEHVTVRQGSKTNAFISYTNFFRLFDKVGGMTGTAASEADELDEIYNLKVVQVPTNKPMIRNDDNVVKLFHKKADMYEYALDIITEKHKKGQPLLLCTPSVFDSESLSNLLESKGLNHYVLNAKNHEQEASIVAQAGKSFMITIATNMAGRGTDIGLGGSIEAAIQDMQKNNPDLDVHSFEAELAPEFAKDKKKVEAAGGLCVFILGALESEKSRLQFIGRAGRQGDPGESITCASLEDDLLQPLFKDALNRMFISLFFPDKCNTNNRAQSLIKDIQEMYQSHYFDIRKNTLKYDDVINFQRKAVYNFRDYMMSTDSISAFLEKLIQLSLKDLAENIKKDGNFLITLKNDVKKYFDEDFDSFEDLENKVIERLYKNLGGRSIEELRGMILNTFDDKWYEQINELENLKRTIFLVGFAQRDPVFEFRRAAFDLFNDMMKDFCLTLLEDFMHNMAFSTSDFMDYGSMFSDFQNTDCFCGSGLKFADCHGKNIFENLGLEKMQESFKSIFGELNLEDNTENSPNIPQSQDNDCISCNREAPYIGDFFAPQKIDAKENIIKEENRFEFLDNSNMNKDSGQNQNDNKPNVPIKKKIARFDAYKTPQKQPGQVFEIVRDAKRGPAPANKNPSDNNKAKQDTRPKKSYEPNNNHFAKGNTIIKGKLIKSEGGQTNSDRPPKKHYNHLNIRKNNTPKDNAPKNKPTE